MTSNVHDADTIRQFIQRSGASPKAQVEAIEALERMQQYHAARGDDIVTLGLEIGRLTATIAGKDSEIESHKTTRRMWQERCEEMVAAIARKDEALRAISELWPHDNCAKMARLALSETEGTAPCSPASDPE